ncbi:hypothetical protein [Arenimonas sp.]|uniref:hypothetical protein n=1 Tax=Arenimonas sp. TaxID=1872635 RepID=UPI0039E599F0
METTQNPPVEPVATPAAPANAFAAVAAADPANPVVEAPKPAVDRIPEKYQVKKDDGSLDADASWAKMLDGHSALEKRLGTGDAPPATPDEYAPVVEGLDFEALKQDPEYTGFLKAAHAKGINNDTLGWILGEYAKRAEGAAAPGMTIEEAQTAMQQHWPNPGDWDKNMQAGLRAIRAFVPDATPEEIATLPNNPLLFRVLAAVGAEVTEDKLVSFNPSDVQSWEAELAAVYASEAFNQAGHPDHAKAVEKSTRLFAQRYNGKSST